jgi:hypothetical protein
MKNTRYAKKATRGRGWDVVREGRRRATAHGATKADAVKTARELIREEGGGEIRFEAPRDVDLLRQELFLGRRKHRDRNWPASLSGGTRLSLM